ncbi:WapI family immunity protein [Flavobacterium pallidum]|uniref:Uncharacterized protein n=1 Tax=Flavobacterium pallidum TaxID=2172098 RepID=A0A2S1SKI9_9FLAO|nr:hypothetical protein [Flavobacterium pallidum]AWI26866.1 hypothetical protein HYN49_13675 [Flavobacterium pallidum]
MDIEDKIVFQIFDSGNFISLEPISYNHYNSEMDWDKNWIKTKVDIKAGNFFGNYIAEFMTVDFVNFENQFTALYENLNGVANFNDLEGYVDLEIVGDGIGHFEVSISASDKPGYKSSSLEFSLDFDQTQIREMAFQLKKIINKFPKIGNLS